MQTLNMGAKKEVMEYDVHEIFSTGNKKLKVWSCANWKKERKRKSISSSNDGIVLAQVHVPIMFLQYFHCYKRFRIISFSP